MKFVVLTAVFISGFASLSLALTANQLSQFQARTYIDPKLGIQSTVSLTQSNFDSDVLLLVSNGIPDHEVGDFGNDPVLGSHVIQAFSFNFSIPANPVQAASTSCLPQGPIGFAINGVPMFSGYTGGCCDAGLLETFDECQGHPAPNGQYHYHEPPICVGSPSWRRGLLGVAMDGFPIYGPRDANGKVTGLDSCGGKVVNGQYRYYAQETFPYIIGCFKGTPIEQHVLRGMTPTCDCTQLVTDNCTL